MVWYWRASALSSAPDRMEVRPWTPIMMKTHHASSLPCALPLALTIRLYPYCSYWSHNDPARSLEQEHIISGRVSKGRVQTLHSSDGDSKTQRKGLAKAAHQVTVGSRLDKQLWANWNKNINTAGNLILIQCQELSVPCHSEVTGPIEKWNSFLKTQLRHHLEQSTLKGWDSIL